MSDRPFNSLDQIRLEARLMAMENIFAGLFADISRRHGVTFHYFSATAAKAHRQLRQQLIKHGADSPISSTVAAEVEQAISTLLKKIADYMQIASQGQQDWFLALKKRWQASWSTFELTMLSLIRRMVGAERRFRAAVLPER
jgi:hypothetical protein